MGFLFMCILFKVRRPIIQSATIIVEGVTGFKAILRLFTKDFVALIWENYLSHLPYASSLFVILWTTGSRSHSVIWCIPHLLHWNSKESEMVMWQYQLPVQRNYYLISWWKHLIFRFQTFKYADCLSKEYLECKSHLVVVDGGNFAPVFCFIFLSWLWENPCYLLVIYLDHMLSIVKNREDWCAVVHRVTKRHDPVTEQQQQQW